MNKKQLIKLGVPEDCIPQAIDAVQRAAQSGQANADKPKKKIPLVLDSPEVWLSDPDYGDFARGLIQWQNSDHQNSKIEYAVCRWQSVLP
jgi:tRNA-splicing ligase RtcB (3'-phosphate/5'-hydroxy nucleic acid ligase)